MCVIIWLETSYNNVSQMVILLVRFYNYCSKFTFSNSRTLLDTWYIGCSWYKYVCSQKKKFPREKVLHFPYVADMLEVDYAEMVLRRTLNI